jgi:solute carrier family 25 protein 34/35
VNFAASAAGPALACIVTNPADVARTRLALDAALAPSSSKTYGGAVDCIQRTWRAEGLVGVQRGLGFAVVREASKNGFRIGLYDPLLFRLTGGRRKVTWSDRLLAGGTSGGVAALVCNPLDRLKTLLQLAGQPGTRPIGTSPAGAAPIEAAGGGRGGAGGASALPGVASSPPPTREMLHPPRTLSQIVRDILAREGVRGFWRGASVNVARSVFGTAVQLSTNSRLQELMAAAKVPQCASSDALCALVASVFLVFTISPTDVVRARLYAQPLGQDGVGLHYRGPFHCARRIVQAEGPAGLFKGVVASWLRVGPHTTISLVLVAAFKRAGAEQR